MLVTVSKYLKKTLAKLKDGVFLTGAASLSKNDTLKADVDMPKQDLKNIFISATSSNLRIYNNGTKEWRRNDMLHRDDGPAVEWASGAKEWHREGKLHRVDGPAIERSDGTKEWYRDGEHLAPQESLNLPTSIVRSGQEVTNLDNSSHSEKGAPRKIAAPPTARFKK